MNTYECGCERGDDCTKTTMCFVQGAIEDHEEKYNELKAAVLDVTMSIGFEKFRRIEPETRVLLERIVEEHAEAHPECTGVKT